MDNKIIIDCDCHDMEHIARLSYFKDHPPQVYLTVHLNTHLPWYKRLWGAFLYVINPGKCQYGHYDELIVNPNQYQSIIDFFKKAQEDLNLSK